MGAVLDDQKGEDKAVESAKAKAPPAKKEPLTVPPLVDGSEAEGYKASANQSDQASGDRLDQVQQGYYAALASDPALAARLVKRDPTRALGLLGRGTAVGNVKIRAKGK